MSSYGRKCHNYFGYRFIKRFKYRAPGSTMDEETWSKTVVGFLYFGITFDTLIRSYKFLRETIKL